MCFIADFVVDVLSYKVTLKVFVSDLTGSIARTRGRFPVLLTPRQPLWETNVTTSTLSV